MSADERHGTRLSKKLESKYNRKVKKCLKILERFGNAVSTSEHPTNNLFIGNGGLVCGFDYEQLYSAFCNFGSLQDIILVPDRPYSFVVYHNVEAAISALNNVNNGRESPLYLAYIKEVPQVKSCFSGDLPPGVVIVEDFVSEDEEKELLDLMPGCNQTLKSRTVQHFGYEFDYSTNNMFGSKLLAKKIPLCCERIISRMVQNKLVNFHPDQLTINHYAIGQGIPPHVDTHSAFEDGIASLSLGSQAVMEFRHPSGIHLPVHLPQRSLLVMSGESRYLWNHGITCRKKDIIPVRNEVGSTQLILKSRQPRTSFTFRKVRSGNCTCGFKKYCDKPDSSMLPENTDLEAKSLNLENGTAEELEKLHVHKVYNNIADHFSDTRYKPWPKIQAFLDSFPAGSLIYDIGCGNGKYLGRHPSMYQVGCDMSANLLKICRSRQLQVFESNILALPLRPDTADGVLCIAVLHHLATMERRHKALEEIANLIRVGGEALVYVWALEQNGPDGPSNYVKKAQTKLQEQTEKHECEASEVINVLDSVSLPVHVNRTQFSQQDMLVPWKSVTDPKNESGVYHRYYHLFQENELNILTEKIGSLEVLESYYDKGNWCIKVRKK